MADVHEPKVRSYNMIQIKGKNTKREILVRKFLHNNGLRFRLHVKDLPGKPDVVLPKYKTVIQINGCFWHGHEGCKYFVIPKTRTTWWEEKISKTQIKDFDNIAALNELGWMVVVIWECELKSARIKTTLNSLLEKLK